VDESLEGAKERAWREIGAIDAAHARGEIDDEQWHRAMASLVVPAYLGASTVEAGSGPSGTPAEWEWSRGLVADALDRDGTFLDIGCANGLLMESITRWGRERGLAIDPYGLDIAADLAAAARVSLPAWADRIFVGNALGWTPPLRFDYVRVSLEYVPAGRQRDLVARLLDHVVAPGGRLIVGKVNEEVDHYRLEDQLLDWGFTIAGRAERNHRGDARLAYRVVWIDSPVRAEDLGFRLLHLGDLALLQQWLAMPHVDAWWHQRLDTGGMLAKYEPRIDGTEPTHVFIISIADIATSVRQPPTCLRTFGCKSLRALVSSSLRGVGARDALEHRHRFRRLERMPARG
jgi:SAM-dependent methyltransferase